MSICKHCKQDFDLSDKPKGWMANHSRWCDKNPKLIEYKETLSKSRENITEDSIKKRNLAIKEAYARGCYSEVNRNTFGGKKHSEESKLLIKEKALKSKHRRVNRNIIEYKGIMLDSTWEFELAKRLDYLGINWIRPEPIEWVDDNNVIHNYFPDFYLTEHNLYLDPKNPQVIIMQKEKLKKLSEQYDNIVILDSFDKCKNFSL